MRILFIPPLIAKRDANYGSEEQVGAIEQQVFGLARVLSDLGHETFITRPWFGERDIETLKWVHLLNIPVAPPDDGTTFSNYIQLILKTIEYAWKIKKKISFIKPDLLVAHTILIGYLFSREKIPKIFITHNNDIFIEKSLQHYLNKRMLLKISKRFEAIVALTPSIQNYLKGMGIRTSAVIPNAIDPTAYENKGDDNYILCAAKLVKHKRVEDLIYAYSKIMENNIAKLIIIGNGPEDKRLKEIVRYLSIENRIQFLPFLTKAAYREYLSKCSIFAFPSETEAFGLVVIEAMACGKPVIACNMPGPGDIINHGHDGFLFHKRNISELKQYLEILLDNQELRKKIGSNARKTVEKKYTFEHIGQQYLSLFKEITVNNDI